jgi:hypothetical protein
MPRWCPWYSRAKPTWLKILAFASITPKQDTFNRAIALNPKSPRSAMARGWVYQDLDDVGMRMPIFKRHCNWIPPCAPTCSRRSTTLPNGTGRIAGARGTISQMSWYHVEKSVRTQEECAKYVGYWTQGECRISFALYPGAVKGLDVWLLGDFLCA